MTASYDIRPTEDDIMAVQDRLAALYAELPPRQQAVLDMILAAGLSLAIDDDDTGGYALSAEAMIAADLLAHDRATQLAEAWRQANAGERPAQSGEHHLRWDLRPLLDWFHRPQQSPAT